MEFDKGLFDFLERFGDPDVNKKMVQNQTKLPLKVNPLRKDAQSVNAGLTVLGPTMGYDRTTAMDTLHDNASNAMEDVDVASDLGKGSELLGKGNDLMQAVPSVMGLIDNAKGNQFDTSVAGGGPGKAGGAIMMGAVQGAQAGEAIGSVFGPMGKGIGKGVGLLAGGAISAFAHEGAQRKYKANVIENNLGENALEKAKREEETAMRQGLIGLGNLKSLREKQLGILS